MDDAMYLTGQFLVAMPGIGDPRFERSVIAMCSHDAEGALGIGIGATYAGIGFHDVLRQLDVDPGDATDMAMHVGGPVELRRGFVLHTLDWAGGDTVDVAGRWALSGTLDVLKAIGAGTGPSRWLPALGYAGWGAGQLEAEMTRHGWLVADAGADLIFDTLAERRWDVAVAGVGIDPRMLSSESGTA
ncbi:YqgE/AlgH family protein [Sphingomonas sp. RS2018]